MKPKHLFLTLLAIVASTITIWASDTSVDGIWYDFNSSSKTASVTYRGSFSTSFDNEYSGAIIIPSSVTYNGKIYSVTSIGTQAFYNCTGLTSVTIPNSVTNIGNRAFFGCTGLTSIEIPNSVTSIGYYAFYNCTSLTSVSLNSNVLVSKNYTSSNNISSIFGQQVETYSIGDSVTSIGAQAFYNCTSLTSVSIGNSVTSIGAQTFYNCTSLTSVSIGNSVTSIGTNAFYGCSGITNITLHSNALVSIDYTSSNNISSIFGQQVETCSIGDSVTSIGDYAFYGCTSLTSVSIPNSITTIGDDAFSYTGLTSITIPNSVTSIGNSAFYECSGLTSVTIPNSVTSIGNSAFYECSGLTSVTIGESVTSIGEWAFYRCSSLTSITIPNSVTNIRKSAFYYCSALTSVTIGNRVTSIGEDAFYGCGLTKVNITDITAWCNINFASPRSNPLYWAKHLCINNTETTDLEIPNSVTSIGNYAFFKCPGLTSVTIPNSVTSIGSSAFSNCTGLTSVTIGNSVTSIGNSAFYYCTSLTSVTIGNSVTSIGNSAFGCCSGLTSVTIPNSVTTIGEYAFTFSGLTSIEIPNSVTSIGNDAFYGCTGLKSITIGNGVTSIGFDTFSGCTSLTDIYATCGDLDRVKRLINSNIQNRVKYAPFPYSIKIGGNNGTITNTTLPTICDEPYVTFTAVPNYGYHFVRWADGDINNPRTIELTQDTTFEALFAINIYTLNLLVNNAEMGIVSGEGSFEYQTQVSISASANYGYHFAKWSDGVTVNLRSVTITQDMSLTAIFEKNQYTISDNSDQKQGYISGVGTYDYLSKVNLTAVNQYGYHFAQWSDGNTDNPRTIELTQDTVFKAQFEKNVYSLEVLANNAEMGTVSGSGSYEYQTQVSVLATANYGYHFVQWSDGVTVNLRSVTITQDMSLTAIFEKNQYTILDNSDQKQGYISGVGSYDYLSKVDLSAINQYGYHFVQWSDGMKETKRSIELTQDTAFEALFAKNPVITYSCDQTMGKIIGDTTLASEPTGKVTFEAVPNYGYHFVQWSDGDINNPRTIELTQDTAFAAVLAIDRSGTCGVDNQLTWQYDVKAKTLTISGVGSLTSNYTFGVEAPTQMKQLIIGNEVTAIGAKAFYAMTTINHLTIGSGVTSIGDNAFAECKNFDDITCYATDVPVITAKTFANVGNKQYIYLFVPEGRERAYHRDVYWGEFDVQVKNADKVTDPVDDVLVVPTDNTAEITWPAVSEAETYEIAITRDGKVICSLIFNTEGQLTGIAFAPGRNGTNYTQKAQTTGFRFTVTGLTSNTHYGFSIVAKDNAEQSLDTKSGTFTTTGVATGMDEVSNDQSPVTSKILHNGQLFILRGEKVYSVTGQEVRCKRYE